MINTTINRLWRFTNRWSIDKIRNLRRETQLDVDYWNQSISNPIICYRVGGSGCLEIQAKLLVPKIILFCPDGPTIRYTIDDQRFSNRKPNYRLDIDWFWWSIGIGNGYNQDIEGESTFDAYRNNWHQSDRSFIDLIYGENFIANSNY